LYTAAVADAEQEEELLRAALIKVNEIRTIRNERRLQVSRSISRVLSEAISVLIAHLMA